MQPCASDSSFLQKYVFFMRVPQHEQTIGTGAKYSFFLSHNWHVFASVPASSSEVICNKRIVIFYMAYKNSEANRIMHICKLLK